MNNNILCNKLNKTISDIKFKVRKNNEDCEAICAEVIENNKTLFNLRIYIEGKSLIRTYFDFGKIKYNDKSLFYINRFNANCPGDFVSYITNDEDSMYHGGYLHILVNIRESDETKAAELIDLSTNKLFSPSMEKYIFPLVGMLKDKNIPNLYKMN